MIDADDYMDYADQVRKERKEGLNEYRLTQFDEGAMRAAMRRAVATWATSSVSGAWALRAVDRETLQRLAIHAIGCSLFDLRPCELQWIENEIGELELEIS